MVKRRTGFEEGCCEGLILVCPHLITPIINHINKKHKGFTDHVPNIKKKLHSEKKSSIYTETYIFDTYIFGTNDNVNPLSFLFN